MASNLKRTVIIGLDGTPYRLMGQLSQSNVIPNIRVIIQRGGQFLPPRLAEGKEALR